MKRALANILKSKGTCRYTTGHSTAVLQLPVKTQAMRVAAGPAADEIRRDDA